MDFSLDFHAQGTPLLVSPQLLRARGLGQIDLARVKKQEAGWLLEIAEVKSSEVGQAQMEIFRRQRIFSTQNFLAGIFGMPARLLRLMK